MEAATVLLRRAARLGLTVWHRVGLSLPAECHLGIEGGFDDKCISRFIGDWINMLVVTGAVLVLVPQIAKIIVSRNARGLSPFGYLFQSLISFLFSCYNARANSPIGSYADSIAMGAQYFFLLILVWMYDGISRSFTEYLVSLSILFGTPLFVMSKLFKPSWHQLLGLVPVPLILVGKLPQFLKNFSQKHTGQLSAVTVFLTVTGNALRVYTSATQISDGGVALASHALAGILNFFLLFQIFWYRKQTKSVHLAQRKKKRR